MLLFLTTAVIVPLVIIIFSMMVRYKLGSPLPCATDIFALLVLFDSLIYLGDKNFKDHMHISGNGESITAVCFLFFLIGFLLWIWNLVFVEPKIVSWYDKGRKRGEVFPFFDYLAISWAPLICLLIWQVAIYSGRVNI